MQRKRSVNTNPEQGPVANQEKKDAYPFAFIALVFLTAVIVSSIAKHHANSNVAWGIGACVIALMFAARARWELKGKWWFWVALSLGGVVPLPLVPLFPWTDQYLTGIGALAFVIPVFLLASGCIFLAEKVFAD